VTVYDHDQDTIVVSFTRERDLSRERMIDSLTWLKRLAARLARFDGAYLRFTGPMTVTAFRSGTQIEQHTDDAIWELMYFGHSRRPAAA